jgi:hypothetical protein
LTGAGGGRQGPFTRAGADIAHGRAIAASVSARVNLAVPWSALPPMRAVVIGARMHRPNPRDVIADIAGTQLDRCPDNATP